MAKRTERRESLATEIISMAKRKFVLTFKFALNVKLNDRMYPKADADWLHWHS